MNVKTVKKPKRRVDIGYVSRFKMQAYGYDNLYPQNLARITEASGTAMLCLNRYARFIEGYGFDSDILAALAMNQQGDTADDLLRNVAQDLARFGGFALHVNYNDLGQVSSVSHVPFENCRLEETDDKGNVAHVLLHPDWEQKKTRNGKRLMVNEKTIERMLRPDSTEDEFRNELATLTLGSGAAGMVLSRADLHPEAPRYRGGVTRSATEWNTLCRGNLDRMVTDTRQLLIQGMSLAGKTFAAAKLAMGWAVNELDQFVVHQVSKVHTQTMIKKFGIDPKKVMTIFGEHGNIGPASVPIVLSKLKQAGRLKKGDRIALLGIGSGLNCTMSEVVW